MIVGQINFKRFGFNLHRLFSFNDRETQIQFYGFDWLNLFNWFGFIQPI
jgi:hypothetical protein